jgi:restriction system protein
MGNFWMVRSGTAGSLFEDFKRAGHIGIGFEDAGDVTDIHSLDAMRNHVAATMHRLKPGALGNIAAMLWKFRSVMKPGDRVVTYGSQEREYLLGTIEGDYQYAPGVIPHFNHVRPVNWEESVSRDDLTISTRNVLGSTLTIFEPGSSVLQELLEGAGALTPNLVIEEKEEAEEEWQIVRRDVLDRAHEFIKDRILALDPNQMESLVAALLRAMGYKTRVTPKGPDRGRDVLASPDGLGFQHPRIIAEVKHRPREPMGAPQIRGFIGGLRSGDHGLYVSTGSYTREARYEADRASVPVTLFDLDELATLIVEHYESFDSEGRGLLPLLRVYWPAS